MANGIGSHESHIMGTDEWLTPPDLLRALGEFDLDPCTPLNPPWQTARHRYHAADDGLGKQWFGRVWMNPPYGKHTALWMERLARHGNGIALIFARTETKIFFPWVWEHADAWLFLKGRLTFHRVDGTRASVNSGAPSVLVAYGLNNVAALSACGLEGKLLVNTDPRPRTTP